MKKIALVAVLLAAACFAAFSAYAEGRPKVSVRCVFVSGAEVSGKVSTLRVSSSQSATAQLYIYPFDQAGDVEMMLYVADGVERTRVCQTPDGKFAANYIINLQANTAVNVPVPPDVVGKNARLVIDGKAVVRKIGDDFAVRF